MKRNKDTNGILKIIAELNAQADVYELWSDWGFKYLLPCERIAMEKKLEELSK